MDLQWHVKHAGERRWGPRGADATLIIGTVISLIGLGFLGIGIGTALWTRSFVASSLSAQGTVAELREVHDSQNNSITFAPVVTFSAEAGRSYRIVSNSSSNPPGFEIGQSVRVLYKPEDPSAAKIDTLWQLWGVPIIFSIIGGVFAPTGLLLLVLGRYQKKQQRKTAAGAPWAAAPGATVSPDATWRGGSIDPR